MNSKLINRLDKLEAFAQAALDEATAIRKELRGGTLSSPARGKAKDAAKKVLTNRKKFMSQ